MRGPLGFPHSFRPTDSKSASPESLLPPGSLKNISGIQENRNN